MKKLKLILPEIENREEVLGYKKEFLESGDTIDGSAGLKEAETFEEWYEKIKCNSKEETVCKGFVPSSTYLVFDMENKLIGMIDIRHRLNEYLEKFGGHIGYSVRKSERKKGYATEMLKSSLELCKELNIDKVLITCNENNIASAKTILKCGGILENKIERENGITMRYWIEI